MYFSGNEVTIYDYKVYLKDPLFYGMFSISVIFDVILIYSFTRNKKMSR
ncbi:hypothetical protein MPR_0353 [Myroides profundi]|nr:hypothetical protein MPR_0353 [Myroides profundi]